MAALADNSLAHYRSTWNAREYLDKYRLVPKYDGEVDLNQQQTLFQLESHHKFYAKYGSLLDPSSARLLEYSGGPSIVALISACSHVREVVFSDFLPENCEEVQSWATCDPDAFNWTPFFKHVVCQLENSSREEDAIERERMLRNKMTTFTSANIRSSHPLGSDLGQFDVLTTSFVLCATAKTKEEFDEFIVKLGGLIRPNGFFLLFDSMEQHWYSVEDIRYSYLHIKSEEVVTFLEKAGFKVLDYLEWHLPTDTKSYRTNDAKSKTLFIAQKIQN